MDLMKDLIAEIANKEGKTEEALWHEMLDLLR